MLLQGAVEHSPAAKNVVAGGSRRNPETGEGSPSKGSTSVSPVAGTLERDAFSDSTSNATAEKTAVTVTAAAAAAATATAAGSGFNPLSRSLVNDVLILLTSLVYYRMVVKSLI